MSALTGISAINDYSAAADDAAAVQLLIDSIADPDTANTSGAQAGGGYLDQMSPACAAQLRVELIALKDAVDTTNTL
jgi:hypothetical protein